MAKKSRKSTHKKGLSTSPSRVDELLDTMEQQVLQGNYEEVVRNGERLLSHLPSRSTQRVTALNQLGAAYLMLRQFPQSYKAYAEALDIEPENARVLFNRGMAGRYTSHKGQAVRDLERAAELNTEAEMTKTIERELKQSRKMAQKELKKRSRDFTLDQLIEQENLVLKAQGAMEAGRWVEAEQSLRAAIAVGDYVPQFWTNLGTCLMMQERYDDAEAAFKHALELDRWNAVARFNLKNLPEIRRNGPPKELGVSDSSKRINITKSVTYD